MSSEQENRITSSDIARAEAVIAAALSSGDLYRRKNDISSTMRVTHDAVRDFAEAGIEVSYDTPGDAMVSREALATALGASLASLDTHLDRMIEPTGRGATLG